MTTHWGPSKRGLLKTKGRSVHPWCFRLGMCQTREEAQNGATVLLLVSLKTPTPQELYPQKGTDPFKGGRQGIQNQKTDDENKHAKTRIDKPQRQTPAKPAQNTRTPHHDALGFLLARVWAMHSRKEGHGLPKWATSEPKPETLGFILASL